MIAKLVAFVVAVAVLATAAGVLVVSASFAFFALLRDYVGPSGAAACVTLAAAVMMGIVAAILFGKARTPKVKTKAKAATGSGSLVERVSTLVSDRPVVAASAAVAAGLLAWRNPTLVATVLRVLEPRNSRE